MRSTVVAKHTGVIMLHYILMHVGFNHEDNLYLILDRVVLLTKHNPTVCSSWQLQIRKSFHQLVKDTDDQPDVMFLFNFLHI